MKIIKISDSVYLKFKHLIVLYLKWHKIKYNDDLSNFSDELLINGIFNCSICHLISVLENELTKN